MDFVLKLIPALLGTVGLATLLVFLGRVLERLDVLQREVARLDGETRRHDGALNTLDRTIAVAAAAAERGSPEPTVPPPPTATPRRR